MGYHIHLGQKSGDRLLYAIIATPEYAVKTNQPNSPKRSGELKIYNAFEAFWVNLFEGLTSGAVKVEQDKTVYWISKGSIVNHILCPNSNIENPNKNTEGSNSSAEDRKQVLKQIKKAMITPLDPSSLPSIDNVIGAFETATGKNISDIYHFGVKTLIPNTSTKTYPQPGPTVPLRTSQRGITLPASPSAISPHTARPEPNPAAVTAALESPKPGPVPAQPEPTPTNTSTVLPEPNPVAAVTGALESPIPTPEEIKELAAKLFPSAAQIPKNEDGKQCRIEKYNLSSNEKIEIFIEYKTTVENQQIIDIRDNNSDKPWVTQFILKNKDKGSIPPEGSNIDWSSSAPQDTITKLFKILSEALLERKKIENFVELIRRKITSTEGELVLTALNLKATEESKYRLKYSFLEDGITSISIEILGEKNSEENLLKVMLITKNWLELELPKEYDEIPYSSRKDYVHDIIQVLSEALEKLPNEVAPT